MTTRRITVLIADDHAIVKEGLVSLLKEHDFDVVAAVGDGQSLMDAPAASTGCHRHGFDDAGVQRPRRVTRLKAEHGSTARSSS